MPGSQPPVQVPGFRDRFGERVVVPQPSGALLEYLHFADPIAGAPFFAQALKDRVARLSTFSHQSYCRVRRLQPVPEREGRPALVSVHVPGRRLAELLQTSARAGIRPATVGALAAARQAMAAVALLHDFAPDGFHGALGPERLVLPGEGRVVVAEHVLGLVVNEAAKAWGVSRTWVDLGVATCAEPGRAGDGRRNDVLQLGLVVLAMLLGRPIGPEEYPNEIGWLLQQATETALDGTRASLGFDLRDWLERMLSPEPDAAYASLLDAQKALAKFSADERYKPSPAAWDSFVSVCEAAALRMAAPVVEAAPPAKPPAALHSAGRDEGAAAVPDTGAEAPSLAEMLGIGEAPLAAREGEPTGGAADVFSSWALSVPSETAADVLGRFTPGEQSPRASAPPQARPYETAARTPAATAPPPVQRAPAPEDLSFVSVSDRAEPLVGDLADVPGAVPPPGGEAATARVQAAPEVDRPRPRARSRFGGFFGRRARRLRRAHVPGTPGRASRAVGWSVHVLVIVALLAAAAAAAMQAPRLWPDVFDARRSTGWLRIDSDPMSAAVTIDGEFRGRTPIVVQLDAGSHQVEMQSGTARESRTVQVSAHETVMEEVAFAGAHEIGGLAISTYPDAGRVTIDDVPRGRAPLRIGGLAPGDHALRVETPLGAQEQFVKVRAGQVVSVSVQTVSWISVAAPYDLDVFENGRRLGTTGSAAVIVSPGRHHLEFVNLPLGVKLEQAVDTRPGQMADVRLDLPMGLMNLTCDEPAEVFVDGRSVGTTPLSGLAVPLGSHDVTFENPRFGRLEYRLTATLAAPVRLAASFRGK